MNTHRSLFDILYTIAFSAVLIAAIWLGVTQRKNTIEASVPLENRVVFLETSIEAAWPIYSNPSTQHARISPSQNELFLRTNDFNIDDDEEVEQLIFTRKSNNAANLYLVIADFSENSGNYQRVFEAPIAAVKLDSIMVQLLDLTEDGRTDLIVQGLDASSNQTLTILRKLPNKGYTQAFSAFGTKITIEEPKNGAHARITIDISNTQKGTIERSFYVWNTRLFPLNKKALHL